MRRSRYAGRWLSLQHANGRQIYQQYHCACRSNFQYHTIRANKHSSLPPGPGTLELTQDTSFEVNLGEITITDDLEIEVKMNVAEWFKNPNTWDLTQLYTTLMPNFNAQIMMNQNGSNGVFSLGSVAPHDD
ncbi:MAG: hypothetical protein R2773_03455 [Flavobacteriaceae bacterium]